MGQQSSSHSNKQSDCFSASLSSKHSQLSSNKSFLIDEKHFPSYKETSHKPGYESLAGDVNFQNPNSRK